jgi:hypothetical protein
MGPGVEGLLTEFFLHDLLQDSIVFAGGLIASDSLASGRYQGIDIDPSGRTPITVTLEGRTMARPSREVVSPSHAAVLAAVNDLRAASATDPSSGRLLLSFVDMSDFRYGLFKLGISADCLFGSTLATYERETANCRSTVLIRIQAREFTVSVSPPNRPSAFFSTEAAFQLARTFMGPKRPPAFVRSVSYGRELWLFVSSDERYERSERHSVQSSPVGR